MVFITIHHFFHRSCISNNYQIIKIAFCNRDGFEIIIDKEKYINICEQLKPGRIYKDSFIYKVLEYSKEKIGENCFLLTVLKKVNNNKYITPLQGKYIADIKDNLHIKKYKDQKMGSQYAKGQLPDKILRK